MLLAFFCHDNRSRGRQGHAAARASELGSASGRKDARAGSSYRRGEVGAPRHTGGSKFRRPHFWAVDSFSILEYTL